MAVNNIVAVPGGGGSQPNLGNAGGGGGFGLPNFGAGRETANRWTQGPEAQLNQQLAQISQLAKTDPQAAQTQLQQAWTSFLEQAAAFTGQYPNDAQAKISPEFKVIQQSLSNPDLVNTVQALWAETGGQGGLPGLNQAVATTSGSGGWGRLITLLPSIIGLIGLNTKATGTPPYVPSGGTPPSSSGSGGATPDGTIDTPGTQSWWDKYVKPWLPAAINAGVNIWGAIDIANAGKEAAKIQAEASEKATQFQKDAYNQNRSDQLPFLRTATAANYRLSDLMGLQPQGPRTMPNAVAFQSQPALASAGAPTTAPGIPNFDQMAARYRRQGVV